jgi:alpha-ketoglutarate-dependent taurine dioxygenase
VSILYHGEKLTVFSNNERIGTSTTGSHAWHIDGVYAHKPNKMSFQYILECPKDLAGTQFFPSKKIIQNLDKKYHNYWVTTGQNIIHPLIAKHPTTGENYLVCTRTIINNIVEFKNNDVTGINMYDFNMDDNMDKIKRVYGERETQRLLNEIDNIIDKNQELIYVTSFEKGDLLIRDNLPMMHRSHPTAQINFKKIGLRKMWRVVIEGDSKPTK